MNYFVELNNAEMEEIDGGVLGVDDAIYLVAAGAGIYAVAREMVKEAGRKKAYKQLGYK